MNFFYIEPEVAGELGGDTVLDSSVHPPKVDKLHYEFHGWLGDALVESFPCVIATEEVATALQGAAVNGVQYCSVYVSKSSDFMGLHSGVVLPSFKWLKVFGKPGEDDFGIANDYRLVVSQKVMRIVQEFGINNAIVEDFLQCWEG